VRRSMAGSDLQQRAQRRSISRCSSSRGSRAGSSALPCEEGDPWKKKITLYLRYAAIHVFMYWDLGSPRFESARLLHSI
jgi:hypothetical protein